MKETVGNVESGNSWLAGSGEMEGNFFSPVIVAVMLFGNDQWKGGRQRDSPMEKKTTNLGVQGSQAVVPHSAGHSDFAQLCASPPWALISFSWEWNNTNLAGPLWGSQEALHTQSTYVADTHSVHYLSSSFIYSNNYGASVTYWG